MTFSAPRVRWLSLRGAVLILLASSFWPLNVLAVNLSGIVRPERIVGVILFVWIAGLLIVGLLACTVMDTEPAENTGFVVVVLAMSGGPLIRQFGGVGFLVLVGCPVLAGWLYTRLKGSILVSALTWGAAVTLIAGPVLSLEDSWRSLRGVSAVESSEAMTIELADRPDVFVVVLDGYPGLFADAQDGLEPGEVDVRAELIDRRFEMPVSSWSSYWTTMLSIPSLLEMGYPVERREWESAGSYRDLHEVLSGSNAITAAFKSNGYETHMIESGWSAGACGPEIDHCTPSPVLDEATYLTLHHTVAGPILDQSPGPYVLGTLAGFDWLLDSAARLSQSQTPDFVFMHVVSPHAPYFLRSDCSVDVDSERSGGKFDLPGVADEIRERHFVEQRNCLDRLMLQVADAVQKDAVLIFVSDHGSDRRNQQGDNLLEWSHEAIVERLNTFLAVRLPDGCSIGDEVIVPNLFRVVLDCLSQSTVEKVPERMWVNPMRELDPGVVRGLIGMRGVEISE